MIGLDGLSGRQRVEQLFERVLLVRRFEERVAELYANGDVPGFVHVSIGQEASAVGACAPLRRSDTIASTHRGHGHCLAKGVAPEAMFAELFGLETGTCRGRGGSMHIADPAVGMLGANGIVGAGLPIAVGAAFAARYRGTDDVTVAFFGDGAISTGAFHEAVNLAALWRLPVVFFCENNGYAEFSPTATQHPVAITERARGYGITGVSVDGSDVVAVDQAMMQIVADVRAGGGPVLVEAITQRWHGHYEGDPLKYRDPAELEQHRANDAVERCRRLLRLHGMDDVSLAAVERRVADRIELALEQARAGAQPEPATLFDDVVASRSLVAEASLPVAAEAEPWRMMDAVHDALEAELQADPGVFLAGIDVGRGGNVFALTRGLWERWPDRVLDTPISETAIVGLGVGAACVGLKPVVELMYLDFVGVCFDQLLNQAAKLRYMTGGAVTLSLTVRTQCGSGRSSGSQHSQSLEALLAHIPGLTVVMPSTAADAYGLLRSAIQDPNPVVVIENRALYGKREPRCPADHLVPIGKAAVRRSGRDLTIVSYSRMALDAMKAAELLASEGVEAEVIDLRTVAPVDWPTVFASVERTGRLLIAHEAVADFGVGAEIAARVASDGFWNLDAPIVRVGAPASPAPYSPSLEAAWHRGAADIANAARQLVEV